MLYVIPTKKGIGVELWGTYEDLKFLYGVIGKFWNDEEQHSNTGYKNRDLLISGFSYELRHGFQGDRLTKPESHFSFDPCNHFGVQISWVHFLFSLSALRYNMSYQVSDKLGLSLFLQLEYWLEHAMTSFEPATAKQLIPFINGGIFAANECLYQFMRSIDIEYISLCGGKSNFKKLPALLKKAVYFTEEYKAYMAVLIKDGKRLKCHPSELELEDDNISYDQMEW